MVDLTLENLMLRKQRITLILTVFLLSMQMSCIPFGDAWVKFSGHVKDKDGKPIKGVQLKILFDGELKGKNSETQSNEEGEYSFFEDSCPCEFEFLVIAAKDGYKIYTKKMTGKEANDLKTLDITMERLDAPTSPTNKNSFNPPR